MFGHITVAQPLFVKPQGPLLRFQTDKIHECHKGINLIFISHLHEMDYVLLLFVILGAINCNISISLLFTLMPTFPNFKILCAFTCWLQQLSKQLGLVDAVFCFLFPFLLLLFQLAIIYIFLLINNVTCMFSWAHGKVSVSKTWLQFQICFASIASSWWWIFRTNLLTISCNCLGSIVWNC